MWLWPCVAAVALFCACAVAGPRYSSRIVDTQAGPIRGIIQSSNSRHVEPVEIFYGVPYAAPPIGQLRFSSARPPASWPGTRLADMMPPPCPQPSPAPTPPSPLTTSTSPPPIANHSEDCLHLNIFVPGSGSRGMYAPYAVVFYVHGGASFERGSGAVYDGRILTSLGHVIFITLNYRLGVLGFLRTEEAECCFALTDIEAALRWVAGNIAAFGGDPSRVTLLGHDTGAALVDALLLRPSSKGLFQRASLMSGCALSPWATPRRPLDRLRELAERLDCVSGDGSGGELRCLRAAPVDALVGADLPAESAYLPTFGPWFDGGGPIARHESAGDTFVGRQLLLGLTSAESFGDLPLDAVRAGIDIDDRDRMIRSFVESLYDRRVKEIFWTVRNEYGGSGTTARDAALDALSDGGTAAPLVRLAFLHSRRGADTYLFHLARQPDPTLRAWGLSSVRGDILRYVLGEPLTSPHADADAFDMSVAHTILRFFTNFAKTGDPNSPGAEPDYENDKASANTWDAYDPARQLYLVIGAGDGDAGGGGGGVTEGRSHYRAHKLALWLNLVQQLASLDDASKRLADDEQQDPLYAGVVRPKVSSVALTATAVPAPAANSAADCPSDAGAGSLGPGGRPPRAAPPSLTGPWIASLAVGCLLLLCNLTLFASVCHSRLGGRPDPTLASEPAPTSSICPGSPNSVSPESEPEHEHEHQHEHEPLKRPRNVQFSV